MRYLWLCLALLGARPLAAQRFQVDPDWCLTCRDTQEHFVSGMGVQIATLIVLPRAPAWKRIAVTTTITAAYELGQEDASRRAGLSGPGYGFGPKDLLADVLGAALVEFVHWKINR